jgi:hypothetical protein
MTRALIVLASSLGLARSHEEGACGNDDHLRETIAVSKDRQRFIGLTTNIGVLLSGMDCGRSWNPLSLSGFRDSPLARVKTRLQTVDLLSKRHLALPDLSKSPL